MSEYLLDVTVEDGKYTVRCDSNGKLYALRYGEPWRDLMGDKLIYCLASEVARLRKINAEVDSQSENKVEAEQQTCDLSNPGCLYPSGFLASAESFQECHLCGASLCESCGEQKGENWFCPDCVLELVV